MESAGGTKKPHMGRRRLVVLGIGGGMIAVGLLTLADQALVASLIQPFLGSPGGTSTASAFMPFGDMSYVAYAIGFGILMAGVGLVRSTFRQSLSSYASGGSSMGMGGFSQESMQKMMEASVAQMNAARARAAAPAAAAAPVVKVKCPKCGSLEEEDAAFCHKCGSAMGGPAPAP